MLEAIETDVPVRGYLHWSLVDNYEWGTYEPRLGLFGLDRDLAGGVRWQDTDAQGHDAAGAFSRLVHGLLAGDRSVLEPGDGGRPRPAGAATGRRHRSRLGVGLGSSARSLRRPRTNSTTMTTTMRPRRMSEARLEMLSNRGVGIPHEIAQQAEGGAPDDTPGRVGG